MNVETRILSSLEKVFPDQAPQACTVDFSLLQNEAFAFQAAVFPEKAVNYNSFDVQVSVCCDLPVTVKQVQWVPSLLPCFSAADGRYLTDQPGLFPDPLIENPDSVYRLMIGRWNSFMIEVLPDMAAAGQYPLTLTFTTTDPLCPEPGKSFTVHTELTVIPARLPASDLKYTCWFHGDCLADYYQVPVFSEEHWAIMERQLQLAVRRGQNMILTPIFTPPLDTKVGGERTTIQLIGVTRSNGSYSFDFSKLDRWIQVCQRCGIRYFEISHLFTQWGAFACPKVIASVDGIERQIFGWDQEALCEGYRQFLAALLPALTQYFTEAGLQDFVYFHISDEPRPEHLTHYLELKNVVAPLLSGYPIMDAMSDYSYFEQGVCKHPAVATDSVEPFLSGRRPDDFWVYYCCAEGHSRLSNRFMAMPGYRTRMIGLQWYQFEVGGFLHWGLNFYNTRYSLRHIDPYLNTDGDCAFPSGDAFILYPGPDGYPIESQRLIIFHEAIQDLQALRLLESLTSRQAVLDLMAVDQTEPITFTTYPTGEEYLLRLRWRVNQAIAETVSAHS